MGHYYSYCAAWQGKHLNQELLSENKTSRTDLTPHGVYYMTAVLDSVLYRLIFPLMYGTVYTRNTKDLTAVLDYILRVCDTMNYAPLHSPE